jgi:cellulose synthase/poly-beta-1,6-N-acetylglucosamine synthase-like glycosyltransferase
MISIIITSYKEPKTIGKAIESFLNQGLKDFEIIVSAPDNETLNIAKKYAKKDKRVRIFKDPGKGKPTALNLVIKKTKGNILILSDGDVYVKKNSVNYLLRYFKDKSVGAVTGRPVSINPKDKMFGYWAYILTTGSHYQRLDKKVMFCSGYLYAIRKSLVPKVPRDIIADDAYISLKVSEKNYKIIYEPHVEVYVKYPTTLPDWIRQKKRTAGKFYQLQNLGLIKGYKGRGFFSELLQGIKTMRLIDSFKTFFWFIFLGTMRFYLWFRIFFDFRLWNREFKETWQRVESTK